jgi:hypothetical protein
MKLLSLSVNFSVTIRKYLQMDNLIKKRSLFSSFTVLEVHWYGTGISSVLVRTSEWMASQWWKCVREGEIAFETES